MMRSLAFPLILILIHSISPAVNAGEFKVGVSSVDITPYDFESHPRKNKVFKRGDPFFDTGVDRKFDFEEDHAFGPDKKPGRAGVDDDKDGIIDNCDRTRCKEYLAKGSDDKKDPAKDNYDFFKNRKGTEGDKLFQYIHLGGFGPQYPIVAGNRFATGVHDQIWARALAVQGTNGEKIILISTDLPGLVWKHINPARRRIEKELGIKSDNVVITSTHTHYAPDAAGYWSTLAPGNNRKYTNRVRNWLFQAAREAIEKLEPATYRVVTAKTNVCVDSVTKQLKKENCRIPTFVDDYKKPDALKTYDQWVLQSDLRDPIVLNNNVVAAQFFAKGTDRTIATFVNYHLHPDMLQSDEIQISSEYVHYLRQFVEKHLGGTAVYFSGTLGCQIGSNSSALVPLWNKNFEQVLDAQGSPILISERNWDKARSIGYEVGSEAVKSLLSAPIQSQAEVAIKTDSVDIRVDNFIHVLATQNVWYSDVQPQDQMVHYGKRCLNLLGCVRTDISVARIGDLSLVTLPGEIDPAYFLGRAESIGDYGKFGKHFFPAMPAIADSMSGQHKAILGQANNYLSYLVHRPDNIGWKNFKHPLHYEELVTVGKGFGDDAANKLMQMLGAAERF